MNNEKREVYVYGTGQYCSQYKSVIKDRFRVCGYIDSDTSKTDIDGVQIIHKVSELRKSLSKDIMILIMVEKIKYIFEILLYLREEQVSPNSILLGISYYGVLSDYFTFSVSDDWKINILTEEETVARVSDVDSFYNNIKSHTSLLVKQKGETYKQSLQKLYQDELKIMWSDGNLWCADHDADIYYRFENDGFYNWSYALTFSMMALNHYDNPRVIELGCGDAYWFKKVYRSVPGIEYIGCDIDEDYIKENSNYCRGTLNTRFMKCDITKMLPCWGDNEPTDVVLWMESYCVFTDEEHDVILEKIKENVGGNGLVFVCDFYSPVRKSPWKYAVNSVSNQSKLKKEFQKHFNNVSVYFDQKAEFFCLFASDSELPIGF